MRPAVLIGIIGGIVVGLLQFTSVMLSMKEDFGGTWEMFLYYSPQIVYFMCIYMSIKMFTRAQPNPVPEFKGCLKAGGITAVLISVIWGIALIIAFTHIDVAQDVKHMIATGHKAEVNAFLSSITMQEMVDRAQMFTIPNFLLGFAMSVLVTVILRMRGKREQDNKKEKTA